MTFSELLPYYINKDLRNKGWESDDERVYIPWPLKIKGKRYYLGISENNGYYKYSRCKKQTDGTFKILRTRMRDTPINNDIQGLGNVVILDLENNRIPNPKGQREDITKTIKLIMNTTDKNITFDDIKEVVIAIVEDIEKSKCLDILFEKNFINDEYESFKKKQNALIKQFEDRKKIGNARQELAKWLKTGFDIILRKNTHDIYIIDENNDSYTEVTHDELMYKISEILGPQLINDEDLKWALSYISDRLEPQHNIVKFSNCIFDMEKLKLSTTNKSVFTLVETPYRYNPNAQSTVLKEFLFSSLKKDTDEKTEEVVQGVKELVGYLFTSGNPLNLLPMITGISGGGKSVLANILIAIFGKNKIADLKLQEIEKNTHATSSLVNKHLNIIQDSDDSAINNNSLIKQITGNDSLQVNPKHVDPFVLPKEEIPKSIVICNSLPHFKILEQALLERFLIIEFNVKFRGTDKEDPKLLDKILGNDEEIEWFIFESIQAYKEMVEKGNDFVLRKDGDATRELVDKHQNPLNYLLCQLIDEHNPNEANKLGYVYTKELNAAIRHLAEIKGIELTLNRKGLLSSKQVINTIRYEFDLYTPEYKTSTYAGSRYYPDLVPNKRYWDIVDQLFDKESSEKDSEEGENAVQNA